MTLSGQLFPGYRPRKVEDTTLYETVQEHWPTYQQLTREHGSPPKFVRREFDDYLKCCLMRTLAVVALLEVVKRMLLRATESQ